MKNNANLAYCGTDCGPCEWKAKTGCKGCKEQKSEMFWGKCEIALCAINKEVAHCGQCSEFPCAVLVEYSYDSEHGDNGKRIENLKNLKS